MKRWSDGHAIPEVFTAEIVLNLSEDSPLVGLRSMERTYDLKWTWRMRYRWWRADLRERLHDWLFPEYRRDE